MEIKRLHFIKKFRFEAILILIIIIYFVYFNTASFLRYENYFTGRFDLGNMVQAVWNTSHGRVFEVTSDDGSGLTSRLSGHSDFLLIIITPFYYIWRSPEILLLIQTIVVSLGAVFIYLIAGEILNDKKISLVLSAVYLLNPAVQFANLYDFHAETLATTFILATFYFLLKKKDMLMVIFTALAGLSKENIWLITSFIGVYLFVFRKEKILGFAIFIISLLLFYYLIWIAIPSFSVQGKHFALSYYTDFGSSPEIVVKNVILNPLNTLKIILGSSQQLYIKQLFAPLGFLSIFSPYIFFAIPELILLLISKNGQLHSIYYHYSSTITPFIFISAIYGAKYLLKIVPRLNTKFLSIYIIFFTLASAYFFGPLPFAKYPSVAMFTQNLTYANTINNYLRRVHKKYSIASTNNLGSHISERKIVYTLPQGIGKADYIMFLIRKPYDEQYKLDDLKTLSLVNKDKKYVKIFEYQGFVVFKRVDVI